MKIIKCFVFCTIFMFVMVISASAQEEYIGPTSGDLSISPMLTYANITYDEDDSTDSQTLVLETSIGYYFSKQLEVGGTLSVSGSGETWTDSATKSLAPYGSYHFFLSDSQRFIPFAGGEIRFTQMEYETTKYRISDDYSYETYSTDESDTYTELGAFAGLDYFISKNISLRGKLEITRSIDGDFKYSTTNLLIGMNIIF